MLNACSETKFFPDTYDVCCCDESRQCFCLETTTRVQLTVPLVPRDFGEMLVENNSLHRRLHNLSSPRPETLPWAISSWTPLKCFLKRTAMPFPMRTSALMQWAKLLVSGQVNKSPFSSFSSKPPSCKTKILLVVVAVEVEFISHSFFQIFVRRIMRQRSDRFGCCTCSS